MHDGKAVICSVSGTTVSCGPENIIADSAVNGEASACGLTDTSFAFAYVDSSYHGQVLICSVSGTTVTPGSQYEFNNGSTHDISTCTLSDSRFAIAYSDGDNSDYGSSIVCNVSGTTIATSIPENVFNNSPVSEISVCCLTGLGFVAAYRDEGNSDYGTLAVCSYGHTIGIADGSAIGGESVPVIIHGISDNHSGLTPGLVYYILPDGSLTTAFTGVKAGLAISETELLLDIQQKETIY